jgi:LCP family protein required for cell wall assembly
MNKPIDSLHGPTQPPKIQSVQRVSLLETPATASSPKKSRRWLKYTLAGIVLGVLFLSTIVISRAINLSDRIFVGKKMTFFGKILDVLRSNGNETPIEGIENGQINILLLGIGGEGHDGPYLTDTIILAQIKPDTGQTVLTSIPRDYLVNLPNNLGARKINAAFAEGFALHGNWDEAGTWARETVEKVTGLSIPYFAVIDFSGFEKAINQVGGIDVTIDRTFTDYSYPDSGIGYLPPITFKEGKEHMNGARALQFARSRHAAGPEGSDFSRSQRQQKVISTFKQKVLQLNLVSDASTINKLLDVFADHFHTNLSPGESFSLYKIVKNSDNFLSLSLDPDTNIICPQILPDTGAYVLSPCPGKNNSDVQNYFKNAFASGKMLSEKSVIWLSSSTHDREPYDKADQELKAAGLTVWELPYQGPLLDQNIIYQVNQKPATAEFIKNSLSATESTVPPSGIKIDPSKVDIIIILGKN